MTSDYYELIEAVEDIQDSFPDSEIVISVSKNGHSFPVVVLSSDEGKAEGQKSYHKNNGGVEPEIRKPEFMSVTEISCLLGVSKRSIWDLETRGAIPPAIRIGSKIKRWRRSELMDWFESRCP